MEAAARQVVSASDSAEEVKRVMQAFPIAPKTSVEFFCFLKKPECVDQVATAKTLHTRLQEQPNALCWKEPHVMELDRCVHEFSEVLTSLSTAFFSSCDTILCHHKPDILTECMHPQTFKHMWKLLKAFQAICLQCAVFEMP